jgi:hypothetical protein
MKRWKPTDADMVRLTLHRTWFTWPSWLYFAVFDLEQYNERLERILFTLSSRPPK